MFSTMTNLFSNIQSAEDKVSILLVTNKKLQIFESIKFLIHSKH